MRCPASAPATARSAQSSTLAGSSTGMSMPPDTAPSVSAARPVRASTPTTRSGVPRNGPPNQAVSRGSSAANAPAPTTTAAGAASSGPLSAISNP